MQYSSALVMAFAASSSAAVLKVAVGQSGLTYTPNDLTAAVGDFVEFSFFPKNHTVTQSSFAKPCVPLEGGFFSGFVPTNASTLGSTFTIEVKDTKPIWVYCGQTVLNHCQSGMTAAINAPKEGPNNLLAFQALAKNASTSTSPAGGAVGGVLKLSGAGGVVSPPAPGSSGTPPAPPAAGGNGTSTWTSTYTTSYATTEVKTTLYPATVTSAGNVYTTALPSTYTTQYTTAQVTTATGASTPSGAAGSPPSGTGVISTGAASGLVANMGALGAAIVVAWAMI